MNKIIEHLMSIAKAKGYIVRLEPIDKKYSHLTNNSHVFYACETPFCRRCKKAEKHIIVYYVTKEEQLSILAHEVGHIETKDTGWSLVEKEFNASKWALDELKPRVNKLVFNRSAKRLQKYLNTYLVQADIGQDSISLLEKDGE